MIHSTLSKTSVYIFHQYTYWIILQFKKKIPYHFPISSYRFCISLYVQFSTHILCIFNKNHHSFVLQIDPYLAKMLLQVHDWQKDSIIEQWVYIQMCMFSCIKRFFFFTFSLFHLLNLQADRERGFNFDAYVFFLPTWKHYFIHVSI